MNREEIKDYIILRADTFNNRWIVYEVDKKDELEIDKHEIFIEIEAYNKLQKELLELKAENERLKKELEYVDGVAKDLLEPDKWISAKNKLPNAGENVLIFDKDLGVRICFVNNRFQWINNYKNEALFGKPDITHWKRLPQIPK